MARPVASSSLARLTARVVGGLYDYRLDRPRGSAIGLEGAGNGAITAARLDTGFSSAKRRVPPPDRAWKSFDINVLARDDGMRAWEEDFNITSVIHQVLVNLPLEWALHRRFRSGAGFRPDKKNPPALQKFHAPSRHKWGGAGLVSV